MGKRFKVVDVEQLLERLSIRFERKGDTLWASCPHPEHSDSSPSWRVVNDPENPKHGQHRCYGCGFGGWPIHLVEAALGCSRDDAREWLKDISKNPPLPFSVEVDYQRGINPAFEMPPGVVEAPLGVWPRMPAEYVAQRGLTAWQVQRWRIGYAKARYDRETNPLAGRIVFPVRNTDGKLIGYTGRTYMDSERRYKEPGKREGADLGAVFGEEHWPVKRRNVIAVTEGAFDALAVERAYPYALPIGGIYGSQLHDGHVNRLSTFPYILMVTDPDQAGERVVGALSERLRRWSQVVRVEIPEGEDAASLAAKDPERLKDALGCALRVVQGDRNRPQVAPRPRASRCRTEVGLAGKRRQRVPGR